jgi:anti-sigma regulatory factor (Ser/Thr protein kinase)
MTEQPVPELSSAQEPTQAWTARAMIPANSGAPVAARRLVTTLFLAWGLSDQAEIAELVVSELVSNSVKHAGDYGDLEIEIVADGDTARLSIADGSPDHPVLRAAGEHRDGGLGLHLVARVSSRWGVEDYLFGKRVWALLDTPSAHSTLGGAPLGPVPQSRGSGS